MSERVQDPVFRWALGILAVAMVGCGAHTALEPEVRTDGGVRDGFTDDAPDVATDTSVRVDGDIVDAPPGDVLDVPDASAPDVSVDSGRDSGPDALGGRCLSDRDCSAECVRDPSGGTEDLTEVALQCGGPGATRTDHQPCESSEDCRRGLCLLADVCAVPCASDADCAMGERCQEAYVRGSRTSLQRLRACIPQVVAAPGWVSSQETESFRFTPVTPLALPGRAAGETLLRIYEGFEPGELVELRAGGAVLFDLFGALDGTFPNPITPSTGWTTVRIPASNRVAAAPSHQILAFPLFDRTVNSTVTTLRGRGEGTAIDLDIFYFPARLTVGGDRRVPPPLEGIFRRTSMLLQEAFGIRIGVIRHHPVVGALGRRLTVAPRIDRAHPNLDEARRLSAGLRQASMPIFWMRDIADVLGVAGNIPGPWGLHGTDQSGIGLSADVLLDAADFAPIETTIVHEMGHFLGLYHVAEVDGTVFEPLADTPACENGDVNGDGLVSVEECGPPADNLMFWLASESRRASAGQGLVVRRSMLVH